MKKTPKKSYFRPFALALSLFCVVFFSLAANVDDAAKLVWGKLMANSKKLTLVKTADFQENIALPLAFELNGKAVTEVSAHINIFPMTADTDPVQIDLEKGILNEEARKILKENCKWGTKIFIENPTYLQKGKIKTMPTIGLKLN
jgi:hypothetical protein